MKTQDGRNALLRINFASQPIVELWYVSLWLDPLTEFQDYAGSRPLWTPLQLANDLITGVTLTPIVPTNSGTITAIGLHSTDVKGSTSDLKAEYSNLAFPFDLATGVSISVLLTVGWD